MMMRPLTAFALMCALTACTSPGSHVQVNAEPRFCTSGSVLLDAYFEGGQLGRCSVSAQGVFDLTLYPEDAPPINPSPWYSIRVSGKPGDRVILNMEFEHGYARYWPKISHDGETWQPLDARMVERSEDGSNMTLKVQLDGARMWVSGQELVVSEYYDEWFEEMAEQSDVTVVLAGRSVRGRPIFLAETPQRKEIVVLLGRQHPPEITGAYAMRPFVNSVLSDSGLAQRFRDRFQVVMMPFVNPDGVALGYWRHNVNGVDLNRDWGPFTQAETRLMHDWLAKAGDRGSKPVLMLDFHSTQKNVFYTQRDQDSTRFAGFTAQWLENSAALLPDYAFVREANETSDQPNSKNYFYLHYGIPAMTYETGDETSRPAIAAAAKVFAEEMMRLLLEYPFEEPRP